MFIQENKMHTITLVNTHYHKMQKRDDFRFTSKKKKNEKKKKRTF